jgi:N-glycosylase/DNA lyase
MGTRSHALTRTPIAELRQIHAPIRKEIESQLRRFARVWEKGSEEDLFHELVFCLLTPQSGAYRCWNAVCTLSSKNLLFEGCAGDIACELNTVRFRNNKARYIVLARALFSIDGRIAVREKLSVQGDAFAMREWLASNVKGMGLKEASHFLRNNGFGGDIAILDRHVLRNMQRLGLIDEIPGSLGRRRYLDIEERLRAFAKSCGIPLSHLDFVLWYREAGGVFK